MPPKNGYNLITLSAATGKPVRPRRGMNVIYAVKGPRGGIKPLQKKPQKYFKTDAEGLRKIIKDASGKNFIIYEQKLRSGKKKLTYAQPRRKQKPVLYLRQKRARDLDIGFKKGNYAKARAARKLIIAKPNVTTPIELTLTGRTIYESIQKIQLNVTGDFLRRLKKEGLFTGVYYSIIIKIRTPEGVIKIPVNDSFRTDGFPSFPDRHSYMKLPGESRRSIAFRSEVRLLANLHSKMAYSIRRAIKDAGSGYRFTSLTTLNEISKRVDREIKQAEARGASMEDLEMLYGKKDALFNVGYRKAKDLEQLKRGDVTIYVRFEVM